ncbi:HAD family hydrolase, partial [Patescibacteria group bacterium]|nr:HAD family hydrolase [Patescibacteria group bacterium]
QIVISNTATPDLHGFLELVRLTRYFSPDKVLGADAHQPHQRRYKIDILREYIQDKEFERVIIIGDSKGDIELGALPNTTTYLYRHPYLDMPDYQADFSIRSLKELEPEI